MFIYYIHILNIGIHRWHVCVINKQSLCKEDEELFLLQLLLYLMLRVKYSNRTLLLLSFSLQYKCLLPICIKSLGCPLTSHSCINQGLWQRSFALSYPCSNYGRLGFCIERLLAVLWCSVSLGKWCFSLNNVYHTCVWYLTENLARKDNEIIMIT